MVNLADGVETWLENSYKWYVTRFVPLFKSATGLCLRSERGPADAQKGGKAAFQDNIYHSSALIGDGCACKSEGIQARKNTISLFLSSQASASRVLGA